MSTTDNPPSLVNSVATLRTQHPYLSEPVLFISDIRSSHTPEVIMRLATDNGCGNPTLALDEELDEDGFGTGRLTFDTVEQAEKVLSVYESHFLMAAYCLEMSPYPDRGLPQPLPIPERFIHSLDFTGAIASDDELEEDDEEEDEWSDMGEDNGDDEGRVEEDEPTAGQIYDLVRRYGPLDHIRVRDLEDWEMEHRTQGSPTPWVAVLKFHQEEAARQFEADWDADSPKVQEWTTRVTRCTCCQPINLDDCAGPLEEETVTTPPNEPSLLPSMATPKTSRIRPSPRTPTSKSLAIAPQHCPISFDTRFSS